MVGLTLSDHVQANSSAPFLSLAGTATSRIFIVTNVLSQQTRLLSRQKYACRDKTFVETKLCFFLDKHTFVATNICRDKSFVAKKKDTCGSSRQRYFSMSDCQGMVHGRVDVNRSHKVLLYCVTACPTVTWCAV